VKALIVGGKSMKSYVYVKLGVENAIKIRKLIRVISLFKFL
jgi:hypothetical protein